MVRFEFEVWTLRGWLRLTGDRVLFVGVDGRTGVLFEVATVRGEPTENAAASAESLSLVLLVRPDGDFELRAADGLLDLAAAEDGLASPRPPPLQGPLLTIAIFFAWLRQSGP